MNDIPTVVVSRSGVKASVRHRGLQGVPGEDGASGDVEGPLISVNDNIAVFDGTDGDTIKDGGTTIAAILAAIALKETSVAGMGLSEEDFTTVEKAKLAGLLQHFVGTFADEATLVAAYTVANTVAGDYAVVVDPVPDPLAEQLLYHWDSVNTVWTKTAPGSTPSTAVEILDALEDADTAGDIDRHTLTQARLDKLNESVSTATFDAAIAAFTGGTAFAEVVPEPTAVKVLALGDAGKYIRLAVACDITISNDVTANWVNFPETRFRVVTTAPTFTLGAGVTLHGEAAVLALPADSNFSLKRVGPDEWDAIV